MRNLSVGMWAALLGGVLLAAACGSDGGFSEECVPGQKGGCQTTCGSAGSRDCSSAGIWGECLPPSEIPANSIDDDCDGQTDEDVTGECAPAATQSCAFTEGACTAVGTRTCGEDRMWAACVAPEERCDRVDNDCDGQTDEELQCDSCTQENATEVCVMPCSNVTQGTRTCRSGLWSLCTADEACDGVDNDCDGLIDEDLSESCLTDCGTGTRTCDNGSWTTCTAPQPGAETCDGQDNDCDGATDEDERGRPLTESCSNDCGEGTRTCVNDQWGECSAKPSAEICDGLDNDCNGTTDDKPGGCACNDDAVEPCGIDEGECSPGTKRCVAGQWGPCGGETFQGPRDEGCNGLDDNCDGVTDEGNPDGGASCGTPNESQGGTHQPPCQTGVMRCVAGQLQCVGGFDPGPELCDDIDNDCNGLVDDDVQADQYDPNDTCAAASDLGAVKENQGARTFLATLYPDGDEDWYRISAEELGGLCWPGSPESYELTITLRDVAEGKDYDLCAWPVDEVTCGDTTEDEDHCSDNAGNDDEIVIFTWDGECTQNDDKDFYIQIFNYFAGSPFDCAPFTLEIELVRTDE